MQVVVVLNDSVRRGWAKPTRTRNWARANDRRINGHAPHRRADDHARDPALGIATRYLGACIRQPVSGITLRRARHPRRLYTGIAMNAGTKQSRCNKGWRYLFMATEYGSDRRLLRVMPVTVTTGLSQISLSPRPASTFVVAAPPRLEVLSSHEMPRSRCTLRLVLVARQVVVLLSAGLQ